MENHSKKTQTILRKPLLWGAVSLAALAVVSVPYYISTTTAEASQPAAAMATPVDTVTVKKEVFQIWKNFSGRTAAVNFAELRPQVSGNITEIHFKDGDLVEKGAVLYVIDPRPYKAAVNQAKAETLAAENQASYAEKEFNRAKVLIKTNAISERVHDERANAFYIAQASFEAAKAKLDQAELNLEHAYVKAPFSGRVSRAEITLGNLVEAGASSPVLTSIVSSEGIYVDFEVDEDTYLTYVRSKDKEKQIPVRISSGGNLNYEGFIHSFDNKIDTSTGTIRARSVFKNEDGALLPGMFVSVEMAKPSDKEVIVLTERAIGTNQNLKFVYVVNAENKVEYRQVTIEEAGKGQRIISSGLNDGDVVISDGIIRMRPGMLVAPKAVKASEETTSQAQEKE